MPTFKKINGTWQECQALVKEGGAWKEIGAVTAKANGKWADIAPPGPAVRTWTGDDFNFADQVDKGGKRTIYFSIKPELRQYFIVGDTLSLGQGTYISTPIPGCSANDNEFIGGTITGVNGKSDALVTDRGTENIAFVRDDRGGIPITEGNPPVYKPRLWTLNDFDSYGRDFFIKPEIRQFFMVGDSVDITISSGRVISSGWESGPIPGLTLGNTSSSLTITGTITGGEELNDVMSVNISRQSLMGRPPIVQKYGFHTRDFRQDNPNNYRNIPIKPAP